MIKKIISTIPIEVIAILLIIAVPAIGVTVLSNKVSKNFTNHAALSSPTPTPVESPTPSSISTQSPTPTSKPSTAPAVTYIQPPLVPTPIPTQGTKMDSATHIELCKTKAETFKTQTETALVLVYNQTNPSVVELANASTIYETNIVAIKYGQVKEGDLQANFTVVSNYLTNLHDWAVKQIADYMGTVNGKGSLAYNDYYAKCLNNENY